MALDAETASTVIKGLTIAIGGIAPAIAQRKMLGNGKTPVPINVPIAVIMTTPGNTKPIKAKHSKKVIK